MTRKYELQTTLVLVLLSCPSGLAVLRAARLNQELDRKPPTAEAVIEKFIAVTGGDSAYRSLHNILSKGTFQVTGSQTRGTYTAYEAAPNKTLTIFDLENGEKAEQGTSGDIAWERSTKGGPHLLEGEEKTIALREATFNSMLNWHRLYPRAECTGT